MVLTVAEIVTLLAALIGQTGTFVNLIEYLRAQEGKGPAPLPLQHKSALDELLRISTATTFSVPLTPLVQKLRAHVVTQISANPVVAAVAEQMR